MTTTIKILSKDNTNVLIFNAMVRSEKDKDLLEIYNIKPCGDDTEVNVLVTVNGIEIPFKEAFADSIDAFVADFDAKVKERAVELIINSGLDELYSEITNAEWKIRDRLDELLK